MPNRLVVALAYDRLCAFEFGIAAEIFGLERPEMGPDWYRFAVAAIDPLPLRSTGGLSIMVDGEADLVDQAGTIIIPGWKGIDVPPSRALIAALRAAHKRGARIVTLCSGVFPLAATGLLDGKRATTHWRYSGRLREKFPKLRVEPDVLYVDEGALMTSAGTAAGIDLCLHLVRRDFGAKAANRVARRLVVPPHRDGGQAQFVELPDPAPHEAARLSPLIAGLSIRLDETLAVARLASEAGMSERTFIRKFKAATGLAPAAYVTRERIRRACTLLEAGNLPVERIARECGFGEASTLRRHFQAELGVTPTAYRQSFGLRAAE